MYRLLTAEQARILDQKTIKLKALNEDTLIDRAGLRAALQLVKDYPNLQRVVVVVGPGNNGCDGLVLATHLASYGSPNNTRCRKHNLPYKVTVLCPSEGKSRVWLKKKAQLFALRSSYLQCYIGSFNDLTAVVRSQPPWDLLVDAAFGTGLTRPLEPLWWAFLSLLNQQSKEVVALDIPSGLDATTGLAHGTVIRVNRSYTFGFAKLGMVVGDGPQLCGRIQVLKLGFSKQAKAKLSPTLHYFNYKAALKQLPKRSDWSINKTNRGSLLVLGGDEGMTGAAILAATAGARMGAGYVTWAKSSTLLDHPMVIPPHIQTKRRDSQFLFLAPLQRFKVFILGPGLALTIENEKLVSHIYENFSKDFVIVDGGALRLLKKLNLYPVPESWILTPHAGELAGILPYVVSTHEIQQNRLGTILKAHSALGGNLLLKGYRSLVVGIDGAVRVIGSGGPVLAKAGTGDVLTGIIGGLLALELSPIEALSLGVYLHGKAGDIFVSRQKNDFSLVATDLVELIPMVLEKMYAKSEIQN